MKRSTGNGSSGSFNRKNNPGDIKLGAANRKAIPGDTKIGQHKDPPILIRKVVRGNRKEMRFCSLHHHSTFSYMDGYQMPAAHVRRAEELMMGKFFLTEHGNVDSHSKFEKACEDTGVTPGFGCEIYMPCPWDPRGQRKMHLTVLAKNAQGYANLLHLVSSSWSDEYRYYEPTVPMELLLRYKKGLIILSGCTGSLLTCSLVGGKGLDDRDASFKRGLRVAQEFRRHFGSDYYIEVQGFPELKKTCRANPLLARVARCIGARLVGSMDCHYTALEEAEVQKILHSLRPGEKRTLDEMERDWGYDVGLSPPVNDLAILRKLIRTGLTKAQAIEAIQSTADIAEECKVKLPKLSMVKFPLPEGWEGTVEDYWRMKLREGWKFRGLDKVPPEKRRIYKERLRREVEMIERKGFHEYLLIVADVITHFKDQGVPVGPGRGSAAGSLAVYILRITEVDPLVFPMLIFERFIEETREDLPDIDVDFPSEVRDSGALRAFLETKYPSVANIGTFNYFKGKNSLDDVARVYRVPRFEVEVIKDFLIERSSGDLRASATVQDTIDQFPQAAAVIQRYPDLRKSELLEGNVKNVGVHAAGYAVANGDIQDVAAVYRRKVKEVMMDVLALDKKDAERQGILKMDFLGLSTLSALWDMMKWTGMSLPDLYSIPLDDKAVYDGFRANDVSNVFQFDGRAMRNVCQMMKPDMFTELMDCNALSRPGPLHNGAPTYYAAIKFGRQKPEKFHPAVDAITEFTKYQIVYQEQVLKIVREVGDFPWTAVAYIRQIISRKIGEQEFNRQWDRFWEGCQTLHERTDYPPITEDDAKKCWGWMITSGAYAFNAAHCAAYSLLAVWTMFFKQHHPSEFYAASLKHYSEGRQRDTLRDAAHPKPGVLRRAVQVLPPSCKHSGATWNPANLKVFGPNGHRGDAKLRIRAGFSQVDKIGIKVASKIVDHGPYNEWKELQRVPGVGPKTVQRIVDLIKKDDPFEMYRLENALEEIKREIGEGKLLDPYKHDGVTPLPLPTHNSTELMDVSRDVKVQIVWMGTMVRRNIRDFFEINQARTGYALDPEKVKDPHLREHAVLTCEDESDLMLMKIDRWKFPHFREQIFNFKLGEDILLVEGVKPKYRSAYGLNVKRLWVLET